MPKNALIKVEGVEEAVRDIGAAALRKRGQLVEAVALTAVQGETRMKRMLTNPSPSRPGNPPGVDTGRYRSSWRHRFDANALGAELYTDVEYGPYLEYGTSRMAPRPHAGPVAEQIKGIFRKNTKDALDE